MTYTKELMEALDIDYKTARRLIKALKFGQLSAKGSRRLLMAPLQALIDQNGDRTYITESGLKFWTEDAQENGMDGLIYTDDGKMFALFGRGSLVCVVRIIDGLVQFFGRTNRDVKRANETTRINLVLGLFGKEPLPNPYDEFETLELENDILEDFATYL